MTFEIEFDQYQIQLNHFGMAVKRARLHLQWTQKQLARRLHVSSGYISQIECGIGIITTPTFLKLRRYLGKELDSFRDLFVPPEEQEK